MDSRERTFDPTRPIFQIGSAQAADWLSAGNAALTAGRYDEAEANYRRALEMRPAFAQAWTNLGTTYQERGDLVAALDCHRRSVEIDPNFIDGLYNLANAYKEADDAPAAIAAFEKTLRLRPDFAQAHLNYGLALLTAGRLEEAWPHYEARFLCGQPKPRAFDRPMWDGVARDDSTLLVHWEQGWGDVIMFSRYLPLLKQSTNMRIVVEVPRKLMTLLSCVPGVDEWTAEGDALPEFHAFVPMLSLPFVFKTGLHSIPASCIRVNRDDQRHERIRRWMNERVGGRSQAKRIGIAWQGDPTYRFDRMRSIPLKAFKPLGDRNDVRLISLQKGLGTEQLQDTQLGFNVADFSSELDCGPDAFVDTAALMQQLDLVVTPDTAVAHLAGSLGIRTWLCLSRPAHWVWLTDRSDSPWYPSIRVFRQEQPGDWSSVFAKLTAELDQAV